MLPKRTLDTMSEAIAQSSPDGKMSKAARAKATERLRKSLFGDGLKLPGPAQPTEKERIKRQIKEYGELADRGMSPKKYRKQAKVLENKLKGLNHGRKTNT